VLRSSVFASHGISTLVERALQIRPFLKNKANFSISHMAINVDTKKHYENKTLVEHGKNKANTNPNKANFCTIGFTHCL
jgi:hypothetical protein